MPDPALSVIEGKGSARKPLATTHAFELYNTPARKVTYLVDRLIGTGAKFAITGTRGVWKTWTLTHLACCVAFVQPFLGRFAISTLRDPRQGSVLFIQREEKPWQAQRKIQWILKGMEITDPMAIQNMLFEWILDQPFKLGQPGRLDELKQIIDLYKPDLVLWDSLLRIHDGEANSDEYADRLIFMLDQLQEVWPSAHGFTAHFRKRTGDKEKDTVGERVRGTSAIIDQVDAHLAIERDRVNDFATLTPDKNRDGDEYPSFNFRWSIVDSEGMAYPEWIGMAVDREGGTDARAMVIDLLRDGNVWTLKRLEVALGGKFTYRQIKYAVESLEWERIVLVSGGNRQEKSIRLRDDTDRRGHVDIRGQSGVSTHLNPLIPDD